MDPVSLVISALAAGASSGLTGAAGAAIADAYAALKSLLRRRLSDNGQDPAVVDQPQKDPQQLETALAGQLTSDDIDDQILAAARQLLERVDPHGALAGKYVVTVDNSKGVVIGDRNTVNQVIN
jgi:hypothetical protein